MRPFFNAILLISCLSIEFVLSRPQSKYVGTGQLGKPIEPGGAVHGDPVNDQQMMKETAVGEIGEKMRQHEMERRRRDTVGQKVDEGIVKAQEIGQEMKESAGEKVEEAGEKIREARGMDEEIGNVQEGGQEMNEDRPEFAGESAGQKTEDEEASEKIPQGQDEKVDEGIGKVEEAGQGIKESAGEKVEEASEKIRQAGDAEAQEGIGEKAEEQSHQQIEREDVGKVDEKMRKRRNGALGVSDGWGKAIGPSRKEKEQQSAHEEGGNQ